MAGAHLRGRIRLRRGRARPLWHGHPWVFSEAIAQVDGSPGPGDAVEVLDDAGRRIGEGFYSPGSQIRVRLLAWHTEEADEALIARRLAEAIRLRRRLGLPIPAAGAAPPSATGPAPAPASADTDCYRLVNSEGDGLPGLIVDAYGPVAVVSFTSVGMKRRESLVFELLAQQTRALVIAELPAGAAAAPEGLRVEPRLVRGDLSRGLGGAEEAGSVRVCERGIWLEVRPLEAQKTGLFLDQRENHARVGELARGARVLDAFTYVGGFALACARGGAERVVALDSSARACERARAHARLNGLQDRIEVAQADALAHLGEPGPRYDLIVLDPPKFAKSAGDRKRALGHYQRLNALALGRLEGDALLVTASCSGLIGEDEFERVIVEAAKQASRRVQLLERHGPGPDHPTPVGFTEGRYLKLFICRVL